MYNDNKYRVSVDGQLDMPFDTESEAIEYAKEMNNSGFSCLVYFCPDNSEQQP